MNAMQAVERYRCNPQVPNPDRHRNRPTNWSHRHQPVLHMYIAGRRTKEIAEALGYYPAGVSAILHSPLFEMRKAKLLDELRETAHGDLLDKIRREAIPNLEFLVGLRDDPARHGGAPCIRLRAATAIAEQIGRLLPKQCEDVEDHTIRINLDGATLERMAAAMAEAGGIRRHTEW